MNRHSKIGKTSEIRQSGEISPNLVINMSLTLDQIHGPICLRVCFPIKKYFPNKCHYVTVEDRQFTLLDFIVLFFDSL